MKGKEMYDAVKKTARYLKEKLGDITPQYLVITGSGLKNALPNLSNTKTISYMDIPYFKSTTVKGHVGELVYGRYGLKEVFVMRGRFHYYEGFTLQQVTFPVRVAKFLGVKNLIISNAAGGLNPLFRAGDLMIIVDHINLMGDNPLIGPNDDTLGPRFPDMSEPYSRDLIKLAEEVALDLKIPIHKGVYVAMTGPCLETRAEYRFLRYIGADAVGMSTVPEVIVAVHSGLKVLGFSAITDECFPDALQPANIDHIIQTAQRIEPKLRSIVKEVIARLPD